MLLLHYDLCAVVGIGVAVSQKKKMKFEIWIFMFILYRAALYFKVPSSYRCQFSTIFHMQMHAGLKNLSLESHLVCVVFVFQSLWFL